MVVDASSLEAIERTESELRFFVDYILTLYKKRTICYHALIWYLYNQMGACDDFIRLDERGCGSLY